MCLAIPQKVRSVHKKWAILEDGRRVNFRIIGKVKKGDYILARGEVATDFVEKRRAEEILRLFKKK